MRPRIRLRCVAARMHSRTHRAWYAVAMTTARADRMNLRLAWAYGHGSCVCCDCFATRKPQRPQTSSQWATASNAARSSRYQCSRVAVNGFSGRGVPVGVRERCDVVHISYRRIRDGRQSTSVWRSRLARCEPAPDSIAAPRAWSGCFASQILHLSPHVRAPVSRCASTLPRIRSTCRCRGGTCTRRPRTCLRVGSTCLRVCEHLSPRVRALVSTHEAPVSTYAGACLPIGQALPRR